MDLVTEKEARQIEENFRDKFISITDIYGNTVELDDLVLRKTIDNKEMVNHPQHYSKGKYEPIDVINDWKLDFNLRKCNQICSKSWKKR